MMPVVLRSYVMTTRHFYGSIVLDTYGVVLVRSCKCSFENAKRSFFRSVNALFSKIGRSASEDLFLHLVNSKCLPILLYGLEVCPLNKSHLRSLDFTVSRLLMKLFRTSNIINECCYYFNFKLPSEILPGRFDRFIRKIKIGNESCK